ncbi:MAG: hypothetical protein ACRC8W_11845, partial [Plesiomonas shigelloides]
MNISFHHPAGVANTVWYPDSRSARLSVTQADWSGTYRGKPRSPVTLSSFCRSQALRSCSSSGKNRVCIFSLRLSSGSILLSIIHHYDLYALFTPFFAAIGFAGLCAGAAAIA